jgi:hypothetical protein
VGAWKAVQNFLPILNLIPESVLPASHIGVGRPTKDSDLPALVVAIREVKVTSVGLGGLVGLGKLKKVEEEDTQQWKETRGSRSSGLLTIEVWGSTAEKILELTNAVFKQLETSEAKLGEAGFLKFANQEVRPIEEAKLGAGDSKALRMAIGFSIVYEEIKSDTIGPEGIIKRINVDINDQFDESMSIHK